MKKSKIISLICLIVIMVCSLTLAACGEAKLQSIKMDQQTFKLTYAVGEQIDYSQMEVLAIFDDESTKTYRLTDDGVTYTPIDVTTAGTKEFKVSVNGIEYKVNVEVKAVESSLAFKENSYKTVYEHNEVIDYSTIKLVLTYNDSTTKEVSLTDEGVTYTPINTQTVGTKTIVASYKGFTAVVNCEVKAVLSSIELINVKEKFAQGEVVDYSAVKVLAHYSDETSKQFAITATGVEITQEIDTQTPGSKKLIVTYSGKTAEKTVTVEQPTVAKIEFDANSGLKAEYKVNEAFNASQVKIKVTQTDATSTTSYVYLNDSAVAYSVDLSTQGTKTLSVTYGGRTITTTINVVAVLQSIEFKQGTPIELYLNETIDYSKIFINLIYNDDNANRELALTESGVEYTPIDVTVPGTAEFKATYQGLEAVINVTVVKKIESINLTQSAYEFNQNSTVDYSTIYLKVVYADNTFDTISLADAGVEHNQIDTSKLANNLILTVGYKGKFTSANVTIRVILSPNEYNLPQSYLNYKEESKQTDVIGEAEFTVRNSPYLVGTQNKFKFMPQAAYFDFDLKKTVKIENPKTLATLYVKNGETYTIVDDYSTYMTKVENLYQFNDSAIDKFFKLEVSLDGEEYDISYWTDEDLTPKVTAEFKVVKGYNVYDTYGLSVMDNLNVKNWAKIKNRQLEYDDKELSEYTDVELVILHNNIVINADQLPSNYFWQECMPDYQTALANAKAADKLTEGGTSPTNFAGLLKGSLRDSAGGGESVAYNHCIDYKDSAALNRYDENGDGIKEDYGETWESENMQKAFFNTDKCSVAGNYMTVSTEDSETRRLKAVLSSNYIAGDENSMLNPMGHWSIFKFHKQLQDTRTVNITLSNLFMQGNMPKVNTPNIPVGLIAINSIVDTMTLENVITNQFYMHVVADSNPERGLSAINFKNSKTFDAYSNMFSMWRSTVTIENCIMKNAGGPIFVLTDDDRTETVNELTGQPLTDDDGPVLKIDANTVIESFAAGTEAWYQIWNATPLLTQLSGLNALVNGYLGKSYVHNYNGAYQMNVIAVLIPDPGSVLSASSGDPINIYGKVEKANANGTTDILQMNNPLANTLKTIETIGFVSGNQYAFMDSESSLSTKMPDGAGGAISIGDYTKSTDMLGILMSARKLGAAGAPYFAVILGNFGVAPQA